MAFFSRLRLSSDLRLRCRSFSTILSPNSSTPLSSKEKTRAALALLKVEKNPERVIDICRAASLTPASHLDRIALFSAISKLADSNYFDGIRRFIDEDLKSRSDLRTERCASHAIVLYGQAKMLNHAIRTFKEFDQFGIPRSVKSLNSLLFACILAKDCKEAKRIFMEFPGIYNIEPNLETYNTVIKAFSESGSSGFAYSVLAEMKGKGVKPNAITFGNVIDGFYSEQKYEDVEKVLKLMEEHGVRPGISIDNIRIRSLCKLKKSSEALALFEGMKSRGIKPNAESYFHLIYGFCKEGYFEAVKKVLKSMVNRGFQPDSKCYFALVYYLCRGGDFETALSICKESMAKGWVPNMATMELLVNGLVKISKFGEARELVGQLKEKFSRNVDKWNEIEAGLPQ